MFSRGSLINQFSNTLDRGLAKLGEKQYSIHNKCGDRDE
jgi:hypothetical protein